MGALHLVLDSGPAVRGAPVPDGVVRLEARVDVAWPRGGAASGLTLAAEWRANADGSLVGVAGPIEVALAGRADGDGAARIDVRLTLALDAPAAELRGFELAVVGCGAWWAEPPTALRIAYCGAHSRSPTSRSYATPLRGCAAETSWWVGALGGAAGPGCVLGAVEVRRFATQVRLGTGALTARQHLEGWALAPGEAVALDALWLAVTPGPPLGALERFADAMGAAHDVAPPLPTAGWGSWGHWLERIDAGLMRETVLALEGSPRLRDAIRVVQIDDGWSELLETRRVCASWRPNRRFPAGIAPLAAEITRTGRSCGLWLLPFSVNAGSALAEQHPDWLVRGADGAPLRVGGGESYCLDPTHPGAAAWLRDLFGRLRDWGVQYVKLDFLRALLAPDPALPEDGFDAPRRYAGARTRVEAYRAGLALVRESLGPEAIVVACSAPAAAGVGLVSAHRVGPDIDPRWSGGLGGGVRDAARAIAANWFWNGRTWANDPDYLIPCESESTTRFWATVVAMSGGSVVLSADLARLPDWAEPMLALPAPPLGRAARPLDLFANGPEPRVWHLPFARGDRAWHLVATLNWREHAAEERLRLEEFGLAEEVHVWDAWRLAHTRARGAHDVPLARLDAALLCIRAVLPHPQLVGTDVHAGQGWLEFDDERWDADARTLTLAVSDRLPRPGTAWVWAPADWQLADGAPPDSAEPGGALYRVPVARGAPCALRFVRAPAAAAAAT